MNHILSAQESSIHLTATKEKGCLEINRNSPFCIFDKISDQSSSLALYDSQTK